jgi:hypothetical protein
MKRIIIIACVCAAFEAISCHAGGKTDTSALLKELEGGTAPVMDSLVITATDAGSITLAAPAFSVEGDPVPALRAYIGVNGTVQCVLGLVTGCTEGPVELSGEGYRFAGLSADTDYRIIVTARNIAGTSVREVIQSTAGIAPVLGTLAVSGSDASSITIERPVFATAGNPLPEVRAYIGYDGVIVASGPLVTNFIEGPVDVSSAGFSFTGLAPATYRIIVVAENVAGHSTAQVVQGTGGMAPVLCDLAIGSVGETSIELSRPAFEVLGSPQPAVEAYIGYAGSMDVSGSAVSGHTDGPYDVSAGGCQFGGLEAGTGYEVIVVARNSAGFSIKRIAQSTDCTAPVLNDLVIESSDTESITLARPVFSAAGNPLPAVSAYIGPDGSMGVKDGEVSGFSMGPADVSLGGFRFGGLSPGGVYRIIVVARNAAGYSVKEAVCGVPAVNLYFSEYIEGSSNNKALEIYNAGECAVSLFGHVSVAMFPNGSTGPYATFHCTGILAPGETYVIAHPRAVPAVTGRADALDDVCGFNGNDAIVLFYDSAPIDSIGQAGFNPGTEWSDGGVSTMNRTLRRKAGVTGGDADPLNAFVVSNEWEGYPLDAFDDLGAHIRE